MSEMRREKAAFDDEPCVKAEPFRRSVRLEGALMPSAVRCPHARTPKPSPARIRMRWCTRASPVYLRVEGSFSDASKIMGCHLQ